MYYTRKCLKNNVSGMNGHRNNIRRRRRAAAAGQIDFHRGDRCRRRRPFYGVPATTDIKRHWKWIE